MLTVKLNPTLVSFCVSDSQIRCSVL